MTIGKELLELLACPRCRGKLSLSEKSGGLICKACRLLYDIKESIPILLIDQATELDDDRENSSGHIP